MDVPQSNCIKKVRFASQKLTPGVSPMGVSYIDTANHLCVYDMKADVKLREQNINRRGGENGGRRVCMHV